MGVQYHGHGLPHVRRRTTQKPVDYSRKNLHSFYILQNSSNNIDNSS